MTYALIQLFVFVTLYFLFLHITTRDRGVGTAELVAATLYAALGTFVFANVW